MNALTLYQPLAGKIFTMEKRIETRSWRTSVRGRVAIHAGLNRKWLNKNTFGPSEGVCCVTGCVLGTVEIIDCIPLDEIASTPWARLDTEMERSFGDWSPGRYGLILRDPILLPEPVPAKGQMGWWHWDAPGTKGNSHEDR